MIELNPFCFSHQQFIGLEIALGSINSLSVHFTSCILVMMMDRPEVMQSTSICVCARLVLRLFSLQSDRTKWIPPFDNVDSTSSVADDTRIVFNAI